MLGGIGDQRVLFICKNHGITEVYLWNNQTYSLVKVTEYQISHSKILWKEGCQIDQSLELATRQPFWYVLVRGHY